MPKVKNRIVYVTVTEGKVNETAYLSLKTLCQDYSINRSYAASQLNTHGHYTAVKQRVTIRKCTLIEQEQRGNPSKGHIGMLKSMRGE